MEASRGVLGLVLPLAVAWSASRDRRGVRWRAVLDWLSRQVEKLIGYADAGTEFVFGPLTSVGAPDSAAFAFQVLPVIIFLGALIYLLVCLRVVQYATHDVGGAGGRLVGVSRIESMYAAVVVVLGMSEAPLLISPYLKRLTAAQTFTVVTAGLTAASGSTLVGYALLGAPLRYLLAATRDERPRRPGDVQDHLAGYRPGARRARSTK